MSQYYGEAGMWIEGCREDCFDLCNLQAAGEQLSPKIFRWRIILTHLYNFQISLYRKKFFCKGLTIAVFILVENRPDNIEVLMIWVSVGWMSSRHSSRREVCMGTKSQALGLEFLFVACNCSWMKGVKSCKWCLSDSSTVLCLQFVLIYVSSN